MPNTHASDWTDCPPNTISSYLSEERGQSRRKFLLQGGLLTAGTVVLGWLASRNVNWGPQETLSCQQFHAVVKEYLLDKLPVSQRELAAAHLAHCSHCRAYLQELQSSKT